MDYVNNLNVASAAREPSVSSSSLVFYLNDLCFLPEFRCDLTLSHSHLFESNLL